MARTEQTAYEGLAQSVYQRSEQAFYLKGLLKPFKGKRDYDVWSQQLLDMREHLKRLMSEAEEQFRLSRCSMLNLTLRQQRTPNGTIYLRWRDARMQKMGVGCLKEAISGNTVPPKLLAQLRQFEADRIALNMQMSCVHFMLGQASGCATKIEHADSFIS